MERWSDGSPATTLGKINIGGLPVIMEIRAPRGTMRLSYNKPVYGTRTRKFSFPKQTRQCYAIRAFMKEHKWKGGWE